MEVLKDDEFGWGGVEDARGRMDEEVLLDSEGAVRDASSRRDFRVGERRGFVDEVFPDCDLVDECGRDELSQDLELKWGWRQKLFACWSRIRTDLSLGGRLKFGYETGVHARVSCLHDATDLRPQLVDLLHRLTEPLNQFLHVSEREGGERDEPSCEQSWPRRMSPARPRTRTLQLR